LQAKCRHGGEEGRANRWGGRLDRDLACAIALGLVEYPNRTVTPEAVTRFDEQRRELGTVRGWLDGDDPLDRATRQYLDGRRAALLAGTRLGGGGWGATAAIRDRERANQQANDARTQARQLLAERGTLACARAVGMRVRDGPLVAPGPPPRMRGFARLRAFSASRVASAPGAPWTRTPTTALTPRKSPSSATLMTGKRT
jgi:hypothetical protein